MAVYLKSGTLTGQLDKEGSRMFPWMMSSAICYMAMEPMWGSFIASKSTFIGPLPGGSGIVEAMATGDASKALPSMNPMDLAKSFPSWLPVLESLHFTMAAGRVLISGDFTSPQNKAMLEKRALAMVKATWEHFASWG